MSKYPASLGPGNLPSSVSKSAKSRARREPSGVFQLFSAPQIQQFKEAFSMIDQDGDGIVSEKDLKNIFTNLGLQPSQKQLDGLLSARPGGHIRGISAGLDEDGNGEGQAQGVNFAMFLTMMGERLFEFDSEAELVDAFESFDENDSGLIKCDDLRKWLSEFGDRMSDEEIDRLLKGSFTDRQGNFKYREWIKVVRVNEETEDNEAR